MSLVIFISVATAIVLILFRLKKQKSQATGINSQPKADQVAGIKDYAGVTGNITWKLTSSVWYEDMGRSSSKALSRSWSSKSVWQTDVIKLPAGKFILLMSTPGEVKTGDIKRGGFLNKMVNVAADAVLDVYVGGYFGNEYKSLVNIGEDGVKMKREELKDFMILTNVEPLAEKYFDASDRIHDSKVEENGGGISSRRKN
ncbi:MAG: hypothetical protein U5K54_27865 [Cytophagales bacterium]|nr:hypothetical protein [Cytophagales bacterium]